MRRLFIALLASAAVFGSVENARIAEAGTTAPAPAPAPAPARCETVYLSLSGLTWGEACAARVAALLRTVPGVRSATASRSSSSAVVVRYAGKAANGSLCAVVARGGYGARVVRVVPRWGRLSREEAPRRGTVARWHEMKCRVKSLFTLRMRWM